MDIETICQLSEKFRNAIEAAVHSGTYFRLCTLFCSFPRGCCGYTSDLLAEYLVSNGLSLQRVKRANCTKIRGGFTHTWLMIDDSYYLDITADLFNEKAPFKTYMPISKCYCVKRDTGIYELFDKSDICFNQEAGIIYYPVNISENLSELYDIVIRYIK